MQRFRKARQAFKSIPSNRSPCFEITNESRTNRNSLTTISGGSNCVKSVTVIKKKKKKKKKKLKD